MTFKLLLIILFSVSLSVASTSHVRTKKINRTISSNQYFQTVNDVNSFTANYFKKIFTAHSLDEKISILKDFENALDTEIERHKKLQSDLEDLQESLKEDIKNSDNLSGENKVNKNISNEESKQISDVSLPQIRLVNARLANYDSLYDSVFNVFTSKDLGENYTCAMAKRNFKENATSIDIRNLQHEDDLKIRDKILNDLCALQQNKR